MSGWTRYDAETGSWVECGSRMVACATTGCGNEGVEIEVADDPEGAVLCGACEEWIIPPLGMPLIPVAV